MLTSFNICFFEKKQHICKTRIYTIKLGDN
jgi:hypothetical protein